MSAVKENNPDTENTIFANLKAKFSDEFEPDQVTEQTASDDAQAEANTPNLPKVTIDINEVVQYHKDPDQLVAKIQQQAGSFVFDITTAKGRDACRSHAANIIRCITPALNASKSIAAEAKAVIDADLNFRKVFEKGVREIADNARKPLTEWEEEQDRIAAEIAAEQARLEEQKRQAEQYLVDWDEAISANELFDLRKEKAEREAKEQAEREALAKAEYERQLQERAIERERQRIAEEQRKKEIEAQLAAQQAEMERQAAIERAEKAEREKIEAEQRAEQQKQEAERQAIAREQAAIEQERKRQEEQARLAAAEQARIKAEEAKQAANRAHRQRINQDIVAKLSTIGIAEDQAKAIIKAAVQNKLGALVINY